MSEPVYTLSVYWKDWWDGATAAWRATLADSSTDALIDLTGNGYDLNYDNYPSTNWDTTTGWAADGSGYFDTGILPALEQTIYVAFKGTSDTGSNAELIGARELISGTQRQHYLRNRGGVTGLQYNFQDNVQAVGTFYADGVVAMNKNGFWFNGVELYGQSISTAYTFTLSMYLMALNNNSVAANILPNGYITAACIVNSTESDTIVQQRMTAMKRIVDSNTTNDDISRLMIDHDVLSWSSDRGKYNYIGASNIGFETNQIGRAIFTVSDVDRVIDPYNTDSPIYGYIDTDKKMDFKVRQVVGLDAFVEDIFTGAVKDIKINRRDKTVDLICEDGNAWLSKQTPTLTVQTDITADEGIDAILTDIAWPWGTDLDAGRDNIPYWWATGQTAKREIENLTDAGLGFFYIAADGDATYLPRSDYSPSATTMLESYFDKNITVTMPWEFQRSLFDVEVTKRKEESFGVIWSLARAQRVNKGQTLTLHVSYRSGGESVPAIDVDTTPTATADYLFNTNEDGAGSDMTGDLSVTVTDYGTGAEVVLENTASRDGFVTFLQLNGKALTKGDEILVELEGTDASTRPRPFTLRTEWIQNYNEAYNAAIFLRAHLDRALPFITVTMENPTPPAAPTLLFQFAYDLYKELPLEFTTLGITANYRIMNIRHTTMNSPQAVRTTWLLMPAYPQSLSRGFILDVSKLDIDTLSW